MKWVYLVNLSTTTMIESYIIEVVGSFDLSNFVIKSIVISSYSTFGRGIIVIYLYIVCVVCLLRWHCMHFAM